MARTALLLQLTLISSILLLLPTSPAAADECLFGQCTCESSCTEICRTGPFIMDCPDCNTSTCGASGVCVTSPGCPGELTCNNSYTSTINGTSGGDTLTGTSANERINGFGGNDTIYGEAGNDTIYAGSGNDTVSGGSGDDCMFGEGGSDSLTGNTGSADGADGGAGTDTCNAETEVNCEM